MIQAFSSHFALDKLRGPSAIEFENREDAFQQLLGDGLMAMTGSSAHSYPTKGQDGGIDSFLESGASLTECFKEISLPCIIECKDHDDTLPNISENILAGWQKVRGKLARRAAEGWCDLYQPWQSVRGYVYCVSAVIPTQELRKRLTRQIREFFASLPDEQRPPLETIHVLDWNDIRHWLDHYQSVRDSWLGTGTLNILSLSEYRAGLIGFRRFLEQDKLPFKEPPPSASYHPLAILTKLKATDSTPGVLLVGSGGVGKTRISIETTLAAAADGWRILYVLPGEPLVTTEEIATAVLNGEPGRVLVILEYMDRMQHLDLGALRRSLIPKAYNNGITLRFLANMRPGFLTKSNNERDAMFVQIDLALSGSDADQLSRWAVAKTAIKACQLVGEDEVVRVCGRRPIIALLVAQQIESLAESNELNSAVIRPIRTGDLGHWLRRRLTEDELITPPPSSIWDQSRPLPYAVAAATVMACAPDEYSALCASASDVLLALGAEAITLALAWLKAHPTETESQFVFDELLDRRDLSDADAIDAITLALAWLKAHPAETESQFVFDELLDRRDLSDADATEAITLALAWLKAHPTEKGSQFVYNSLLRRRDLSDADATEAIILALAWLKAHLTEKDSRYLMGTLLHRRDLSDVVAAEVIKLSFVWLDAFGTNNEASFVLTTLLRCKTINSQFGARLACFVRSWIAGREKRKETSFVLTSWFASEIIPSITKTELCSVTHEWIQTHIKNLPGPALALRLRLSTSSAVEESNLLSQAVLWLKNKVPDLLTAEVFAALIERPGIETKLRDDTIQRVINLAWCSSADIFKPALFAARQFAPESSPLREEITILLDDTF